MSLRVAIVGCGKIADAHAAQIRRIPGCDLVGVCDREELMARQLAERFGAERYFTELDDLLRGSMPDVVHVTTPPQSHFEIARQCLEHPEHEADWRKHAGSPRPLDGKTVVARQRRRPVERRDRDVEHSKRGRHHQRRKHASEHASANDRSPFHCGQCASYFKDHSSIRLSAGACGIRA